VVRRDPDDRLLGIVGQRFGEREVLDARHAKVHQVVVPGLGRLGVGRHDEYRPPQPLLQARQDGRAGAAREPVQPGKAPRSQVGIHQPRKGPALVHLLEKELLVGRGHRFSGSSGHDSQTHTWCT